VDELSGFYVSMIFIGILLVLTSLVLIFIDKKNVFLFKKSVDEKKQELIEIINDAEQMIEELNRFSTYIVDQMDLKNEELNRVIGEAEQRINALAVEACHTDEGQIISDTTRRTRKAVADSSAVSAKTPLKQEAVKTATSEKQAATSAGMSAEADALQHVATVNPAGSVAAAYSRNNVRTVSPRKDKVIQFNKYQEVLRLSKEGMDELDIAKNLNMGKGEVELIIGLRR